MAVSPPPTTTSSRPLKNAPSQVAHADSPWLRNFSSLGMSSHLADAPVATMMVSAMNSPSPVEILNGRADRSTAVTSVVTTRAPLRSAWARISSISLGPCTPCGKAGVVFHFRGDGELTAGRGQRLDHQAAPLEHHGRQVGARGVDGGGAAGRATADDGDFHMLRFGHCVLLDQTI